MRFLRQSACTTTFVYTLCSAFTFVFCYYFSLFILFFIVMLVLLLVFAACAREECSFTCVTCLHVIHLKIKGELELESVRVAEKKVIL